MTATGNVTPVGAALAMSAERPLYSYRHALEVFVGLEAFCFRFRAGFVISACHGVSASEDWIALGHGCGM